MSNERIGLPFDDFCARIAAGEQVDESQIPPEWLQLSEIKRLLQFGRVMHGLGLVSATPPASDAMVVETSAVTAPNLLLGPWRLIRLLGVGGMGEVWLGERVDQTVHRVAIKRVRNADPAFALRLDSEKRILARLSHPNIARFIDAGFDPQGSPWLALEFVEGQSLSEWSEQNHPDLARRLGLFLKICAAVEHAHRHLVIHRDLKPANVLVDADGEPRLLDFGIAKLLDDSGGETTSAALTPAYAAPEQIRGQPVTTATDVYALGLLLYRLLAGALPHSRDSNNLAFVLERLDDEESQRPSVTAAAQQAQLPYSATRLRGDLDAIVSKAMRANSESRFGSVAELAADVQRFLNGVPVRSRVPTLRYRLGRFVRRNRISVAFAALAAISVLAGAAGAIWQAHLAHQAAALATIEAANARQEAQTSDRVTKFALKILSQLNPHGRTSTQPRSGAELIQESIDLAAQELRDDPAAHARVLLKLAEIQALVDSPSQAESTLKQAIALFAGNADQVPEDLASMRHTLASILLAQQRYLEAETELTAALPLLVEHPKLDRYHALTYANLALVARHTGRLELAVDHLATAYGLARAAYGDNHPNTIELLTNRGILEFEIGRMAAAQDSNEQAIAEFEKHHGAQFPRLLFPLLQRAQIALRRGQHATAKAACLRGLALAEQGFAATDPQVARFRLGCGKVFLSIGDWQMAAAMSEVDPEIAKDRPELAFKSAYLRAELALLSDDPVAARINLISAQTVMADAQASLPKQAPLLVALGRLIQRTAGPLPAEPEQVACSTEPVLCAAQAAALRDQPAFDVFKQAQPLVEAGRLDASMLGAYQLWLARIAAREKNDLAARQWRSMAQANLRHNLADSAWRNLP